MFLRLYPTEKLLYLPFELTAVRSRFGIFNEKDSSTPPKSKMTLSPKSLAGPGYIILNGIRVMNIIAFMAVIAASIVMLVKISTDTKLYFFDAVSHVVTAGTSIFLITSELSLFRPYFARNWPLLSPRSGFVFLALTQLALGANIMGNLNKPSGNQDSLGLAFWRVVIAAGIVVFILGWLNLIASYIFRDTANNTTARQVRAKGAAINKTPIVGGSFHSSSTPSPPQMRHASPSSSARKSFNPFSFSSSTTTTTQQPHRTSYLPSYHTASQTPITPVTHHHQHPSRSTSSSSSSTTSSARPNKPYPTQSHMPASPTSRYSRATACTAKKVRGIFSPWRNSLAPPLPVNPQQGGNGEMQISAPMGVNPQFAHLVQGGGGGLRRPDSALHPSRSGGEGEAWRWRV
ncbi:unnamed protein product [Zymoseptoria tritici ST99CH_3D7]|uniref:DUF7598 domain-containing protein n=3 Tax=Zymoseptoria tritici TaxID=1047171 RepID=A0A1X7S8E4_ZYMT9|nr:unnamed protein product [Zymoseptoria tritici ST99CH_3D7]SMR61149.1 unnamed protein product [Zymoseptoria tritici ST99CH_1E4]